MSLAFSCKWQRQDDICNHCVLEDGTSTYHVVQAFIFVTARLRILLIAIPVLGAEGDACMLLLMRVGSMQTAVAA